MDNKNKQPFCNVALLPEDHKLLKEIATFDQRSMTRQLSVIISKVYSEMSTDQNH